MSIVFEPVEPVEPVDVYEPTVAVVVACDADLQTRIGAEHYEDGNPCTPLRELITVEDVQRWYEQSPQDEVPAATPYPWETGR